MIQNAFRVIFVAMGFVSCAKSNSSIGVNINPSDTLPLSNTIAKTDTLKVMAYNILNYGDGCQGTTVNLNGYFRTIIEYAQPDLISCEKLMDVDLSNGTIAKSADELLSGVFDMAYPGKYTYATYTNVAQGDAVSILFFNKQKLSYLKTENLFSLYTDFDLYKLFYNDPNLTITKDTTFLYVLVCHTKSGAASLPRDTQDSAVISSLRAKFVYFPNLIIMGDFNTSGSYENGYQSITTYKDSSQIMFDPPYVPDYKFSYPGNWNTTPSFVASCLTTSTRSLPTQPNSCGTSAGAKGWYDHIFISPWLIKGTNYIKYISSSYSSLGNDGHRLGVSINSIFPNTNTSVPPEVLDALFQFSDKYPVTLNLEIKANRNKVSPKDPG